MDATETERERERCKKILELLILESPEEVQRYLIRAANMIAAGAEPITFREQVERDLGDDLRTPPPGT